MPATARAFSPAPRRRPSGPARLRLGLRVVAGLTPAQAAAAEPDEKRRTEAEALVAEPDFAPLVTTCQALRDLPEAERLARLEWQAWDALELALADPADPRVIFFVLLELRAGRNRAATLAKRAEAAWQRAQPADTPPRQPPRPRPTSERPPARRDPAACYAGGLATRGAARLRRDMLDEAVARTAATSKLVPLCPARRPIARPTTTVTSVLALSTVLPPALPRRTDRCCPRLQPRAPCHQPGRAHARHPPP
jgi:hypothetical protein